LLRKKKPCNYYLKIDTKYVSYTGIGQDCAWRFDGKFGKIIL